MRGGWFHTGDVATVDEDGYFFIVDRKKDLIIRGGYNVYPREIEEVLYEHPAVLEAAVVGVPARRRSARRSARRSRSRTAPTPTTDELRDVHEASASPPTSTRASSGSSTSCPRGRRARSSSARSSCRTPSRGLASAGAREDRLEVLPARRRQAGGLESREPEALRIGRELAGASTAVDADFASEYLERRLDHLGQFEELGRDLDARGDPVDDLPPDHLGVARRLDPVAQASDAVRPRGAPRRGATAARCAWSPPRAPGRGRS